MRRQRSFHTTSTSGAALPYYLRWLVILIVLAIAGQFAWEKYQVWQTGGSGADRWRVDADILDIEAGACNDADRSIEAAWEITANGQTLSESEDILGERGRRSGTISMRGKPYFWNSVTSDRLSIGGWVCDLDDGDCDWLGEVSAGFQLRGGQVVPDSNLVKKLSGGKFSIPVASMETACSMNVVIRIRAD